MFNRFWVIETLLSISFLATLSVYIYPELIYSYGLNMMYFSQWNYFQWFIQIFSSQFVHWDFFHLIFNSIFILLFWKIIESLIWWKNLTIFFISSSIFIWIWILIFSSGTTVWMSGFAMWLLAFYTSMLYSQKNPEYKGWLFALFIYVAIWLSPEISLIWHLLWSIFGFIYYCIYVIFFRKIF